MVTETAPEELASRLDDEGVAVVDIRDPSSYAAGHIDGAVNVPPKRLSPAALEEPWAQVDEVVVSCYVGKSSRRVAAILGRRLDAEVSSLRGGFDAWDGPVADEHGDSGLSQSGGPACSSALAQFRDSSSDDDVAPKGTDAPF